MTQPERTHHLTDHELDELADRVADRLAGQSWVDREEHYQDHQWIKGKRKQEAEDERNHRKQKRELVTKVLGGAGAMGLGGMLLYLGNVIVDFVMYLIDKLPGAGG